MPCHVTFKENILKIDKNNEYLTQYIKCLRSTLLLLSFNVYDLSRVYELGVHRPGKTSSDNPLEAYLPP